MPTVRDGRGVLTVHDMGVPVASSPSGPVERGTRRQTIPDPPPTVIEPVPQAYVAEQQRRDAAWAKAEGKAKPADTFRRPTLATTLRDQAAASRARGAAAAGFVKGAKKPHQVKAEPPPAEAKPKGAPKGFKRSPEVRERMRQAQVDRYARARGEVPAEVVAEPAHIVTTESQGREASVPATGADERGPTGDPEPAAQVATPLGSPPTGGGSGRRPAVRGLRPRRGLLDQAAPRGLCPAHRPAVAAALGHQRRGDRDQLHALPGGR